jgi:F-type H+-transporting ATPase subunit alpha
MDAATKAVLDKGARNVEILKQPNFSPVSVEKQIAIIYLGMKGLLLEVPLNKIREFEADFLMAMETRAGKTLDELRAGKYDDAQTDVLEQIAKEVKAKYVA